MCSICGNVQLNQATLRRHMKRHSDPMKCHLCDKMFKNSETHKKHVERQHEGKGPNRAKCDKCDKTYFSKYALFLHVNQVHEGKPLWSCKLCNKGYKNRFDAAIHIATVHEKWPYAEARANYKDIYDHPALIRNPLSARRT